MVLQAFGLSNATKAPFLHERARSDLRGHADSGAGDGLLENPNSSHSGPICQILRQLWREADPLGCSEDGQQAERIAARLNAKPLADTVVLTPMFTFADKRRRAGAN